MVASGVRRSCAASETSRGKLASSGPTEPPDTNLSCMTESRHLLDDLQASTPEVRLGLSRAGVQGVAKAIRLRWGGAEKLISAEIDCTVDLDPAQKGVHMSRFPELFEEAIDEVVIGEAFLVEELADHIARHIVARQAAGRAEVRIAARYPLERSTPVPAPRGSYAGARLSGCSMPVSTTGTSSGFSSWSRSRRTISAAAARS